MPTERAIAKPLSGTEVIEAIVSRLKEQLGRDCYLSPHMAYGAFSFKCSIDIKFQASRIEGTSTSVSGSLGETDTEQETESATLEVSDDPRPPNEVRRESGQEVPVLAKTPQGRLEERKVRYERKGHPKVTSKEALATK